MNQETLLKIKTECETVEQKGFGYVKVMVKNGAVYLVETSFNRLIPDLANVGLDKGIKT